MFFEWLLMTEIIIILGLLVLNGLFAMSEIALVSSRESKLNQLAEKGSKGASIAINLLKEPERFLSTVQIGITLVGIIAGAYGGEAFTEDLQPFFEQIPWLKQYAEEIAFACIVTIITYFSLIIGELVPKSIAMNNPEKITVALAPFMKGLSVVTYPFVAFLTISTKIVLRLFMIKENTEPPVTEEELKYMLDTGSKHGVIESQENEIIKGVFRFGDRKANTVMTHRKDIEWIDINQDKDDILKQVMASTYTKYPICNGTLDKILGVVNVRELIQSMTDQNRDIKEHFIEVLFIPENTPALKILESFRKKKIHTGFVVNEYGGVEGMITLHDLIENIIGDLPELGEIHEEMIIKREDGSFLVDGELYLDELKHLLAINNFPDETSYTTLAGFILNELQHIPKSGEKLHFQEFTFEVVDMDANRIDKVLISKKNV